MIRNHVLYPVELWNQNGEKRISGFCYATITPQRLKSAAARNRTLYLFFIRKIEVTVSSAHIIFTNVQELRYLSLLLSYHVIDSI